VYQVSDAVDKSAVGPHELCSGKDQAQLSDALRSVRSAAAVTQALLQRADELI
jgi:hypothetical protein